MKLYIFTLISNLLTLMYVKEIACNLYQIRRIEGNFTTRLNHFDIWNKQTFQLRYYQYNEFFRNVSDDPSPLLIQIGSHATIQDYTILYHPSYALAKILHSTLFLIEHRFYGLSRPIREDQGFFDVNNLKYLNAEQALEDLALFIEEYNRRYPTNYKRTVGVFGCSHAGSLATWLRYKFPHLVDAVWASSAPLNINLEYPFYYQIVGEIYGNASRTCYTALKDAYKTSVKCQNQQECADYSEILEGWLCGNTTSLTPNDIRSGILRTISNPYNRPGDAKRFCKFLESQNNLPGYKKLGILTALYSCRSCFVSHGVMPAMNDYFDMYQMCAEFSYRLTTGASSFYPAPTSNISEINEKSCAEMFSILPVGITSERLKRSIKRKNRLYGSANLPVTKVFFIYGNHDPWYRLGPSWKNDDKNKRTSHCADMPNFVESTVETKELTQAKKEGLDYMEKWLSIHKQNSTST